MLNSIVTRLNPKHEIRNPKQILNPKFECPKRVLNFDHLIFGFVSNFDIRISYLGNDVMVLIQ
jgi:hypothetical protein